MKKLDLKIHLHDKGELNIQLFAESTSDNTLFQISAAEAFQYNEAYYQIIEGCSYEYIIDEGYYLVAIQNVVCPSHIKKYIGRITPNTYVGTLSIPIFCTSDNIKVAELKLEVRSIKTSYREDYRHMLHEITNYCIDLLFEVESPILQDFTVDFNFDAKTLYQRFSFLKSLLDSSEFDESINRIISSPVTNWCQEQVERDVRGIRKITANSMRQFVSSTRRIDLSKNHPLHSNLATIPLRISYITKRETVDTPENRFVKYALRSFLLLCTTIKLKSAEKSDLRAEALNLEEKLGHYLGHSLFKEVADLNTLPLNSPVLQRKDGYREILRIWIIMALSAKLIWEGGQEDVYGMGKRNVAILYEYWVFFKLLTVISELFNLKSPDINNLIQPTQDDLALQLKQGKYLPLKGVYESALRKLNIEFSYNKTFSGNSDYPDGGSWTRSFRPDYTLSIWPFGIEACEAEKKELIVHLHFDAKYRIENLSSIFSTELESKDRNSNPANYKRNDLIKMHAYRDAIRRTEGAYIIYPGDLTMRKKGFHEIIPGLGAFTLRPSSDGDSMDDIRRFLTEVLDHFLNRASQREKISYRVYETFKDKELNFIHEAIPESIGANRSLIPDDTIILIAFYKNQEHLDWILNHKLYNTRTGSGRGSIPLNSEFTKASYLLLHTKTEIITDKFYKLKVDGPRNYSKDELLGIGYPAPKHNNYLVFEIEDTIEKEFLQKRWDISRLPDFSNKLQFGYPFCTSLTQLMKLQVK
jgi:predicted component of viral defense system (DUF524 family)